MLSGDRQGRRESARSRPTSIVSATAQDLTVTAGGKTHLGAFQRGHVPVQPRRADAPDHADVRASRQLAGGADPFIGDLAGAAPG